MELLPFGVDLLSTTDSKVGVGVSNPTANLDVSGTTKISSTLSIGGHANLSSTTHLVGATVASSTLSVAQTTTLTGTLSVGNHTTRVKGSLSIGGGAYIYGSVNHEPATTGIHMGYVQSGSETHRLLAEFCGTTASDSDVMIDFTEPNNDSHGRIYYHLSK